MTGWQEKVLERVSPEPTSGCWLWTAAIQKQGYGNISVGGKVQLAHRVSYRAFVGEIPAGLELDHLCRVRSCVNPRHLEAVTKRTNILRGVGMGARCAVQTHCKNGHAFTAVNTYLSPSGKRVCRECRRRIDKARNALVKNRGRKQ